MIGIGPGIGVSRPRGLDRAIRAMFSQGEVGVWYDPSDFSTMFQDSAGTTPVSAVGQTVGLMLDKSKGLVLGSELVTNGGFDTDTTGWAFTNCTGAVVGGRLRLTSTAAGFCWAEQAIGGLTVGASAKISVTNREVSGTTQATARLYEGAGGVTPLTTYFANNTSTDEVTGLAISTPTADGTVYIRIAILNAAGAGEIYEFDNISVRKLPGYHATQSTSTARGLSGTNLVDLDGVDDSLTIPAGGGGSTGFFLCAAVRVDGGAGTNRVIYSDAGTNTGYILRLNASNQLELAAGNGTAYTLAPTTATLTAGPYVVTAWDDGTNLNVQVNGGAVDSVARPVVSAGNADFRIGNDYGAATGFFNGAIYPYVYVKNGQNVDANDRAAVKSYVASKAGVSI